MTHFLTGKKAICNFVGRSWATVEGWILNLAFPAKMVDGRWESDLDLITKWRRDLLSGRKKTENEAKSASKPLDPLLNRKKKTENGTNSAN